jgi:hypothetical protein
MDVVLRGKAFAVTVEDVLRVTQQADPAPLARYAVRLHGRWYPPKQVLSLITGFPVAAFTTQDAYRTMQRLGLEIIEASAIQPPEGDIR